MVSQRSAETCRLSLRIGRFCGVGSVRVSGTMIGNQPSKAIFAQCKTHPRPFRRPGAGKTLLYFIMACVPERKGWHSVALRRGFLTAHRRCCSGWGLRVPEAAKVPGWGSRVPGAAKMPGRSSMHRGKAIVPCGGSHAQGEATKYPTGKPRVPRNRWLVTDRWSAEAFAVLPTVAMLCRPEGMPVCAPSSTAAPAGRKGDANEAAQLLADS